MGLIVRRRVTLDLARRGEQVTVPFSVGDRVAHEVIFTLRDGSEQILLPVGTHAAIAVKNGYGGKGCLDSCVIDHVNNTITYTPTVEALSIDGNIECSLEVFDADNAVIGSPTFIFAVSEGDNANTETELGDALKSNSNWLVIADTANNALAAEQAKEDAVDAQGFAEDARDAAVTAQGLAVAARDDAVAAQGLAVAARDAAVTAKYAAEGARDAAVTAQGEAKTSATRAEESAALAEEYVKNVQETGKAVEVVNETGNSRTAAMSQDGVSKLVYPFGAIVEDFSETGTFLKIDRAIEGEQIQIDSDAPEVIMRNSNMFLPRKTLADGVAQSSYGMRLEYNGDGTYTLNGKATYESITYMAIFGDNYVCKAGTYTVSLECKMPYGVKVQFAVYRAFEEKLIQSFTLENISSEYSGVKTFDEDFRFQARIIVSSGVTVNNLIFKPQLSPGKEKPVFEVPVRKALWTASTSKPLVEYEGKPLYLYPKPTDTTTVYTVTATYRFRMYSMKETLEILRETLTDLYNRRCDADEVDIDLDLSGIGKGKVATDVQAAIQTMADMIPQFATNASVKNTITTEISKIVANAPADFNTLKEIADYIASDKTNAANINNTLSEHTEKILEIEEGYVKKIKGNSLNQLYGIRPSGEQTSFKAQANSPEIYSIPLRDEGLQFMVGPPTLPEHAATKKYVDDHTIALYRHDLEVVIISDSGTFHATLSAYTKSNEAINTVDAFKGLMKKDGKSTKNIPLFGAFKASNESVTHICGMSYLDGAGYVLKNVAPEPTPITIANYSTFSVTDTVVTL